MNPSKQIRTQIRSKNILNFFIPTPHTLSASAKLLFPPPHRSQDQKFLSSFPPPHNRTDPPLFLSFFIFPSFANLSGRFSFDLRGPGARPKPPNFLLLASRSSAIGGNSLFPSPLFSAVSWGGGVFSEIPAVCCACDCLSGFCRSVRFRSRFRCNPPSFG